MDRKFTPYSDNMSVDIEFDTYKACVEWINIHRIDKGYTPHLDFRCEFGDYDSSYDWLIPVIDKIEDIEQMGCQGYIDISPFAINAYCSGHLSKGLNEFHYRVDGRRFSGNERMKNVYQAVVNFIKWYNNNPKANT